MNVARFRLGACMVVALVAGLTGAIQQAGAVDATAPSLTVGTAPLDPTPGTDVTITATVVPGAGPTSTGLAVNCDLSWAGLGASAPLTPDITGLVFTRQFTIPAATVPGTRIGSCGVSDDQGRSNSATYSVNVVPGPTAVAPTITSHTPDNSETDVALDANIGIVFSIPVNATDTWFTISCGTSGAHAASVSGGPTSFVLDPATDFVNGESCTVTVDESHVADQGDPANTLVGNPAWTFVTVVSPTNPSGFGAALPSTVTAGGSTLLTMTVTPGANPTSTGLAVSSDLSAIGGSSGQQFYDDGTHGDATASDGVFSLGVTVDPGTAPGSKTLPAAITDAQGRSAAANISLTVTEPSNAPPTVSAGGPYTVEEGGTVTLSPTGSDPENLPLMYAWDLDGNGTYETSGQIVSFSAVGLDGPASLTVGVRATDAGGLTATDTATVNVTNVAPTATFDAPDSAPAGFPFTLALTGPNDPSTADTAAGFTYAFDCGSGYGSFGPSTSATCLTTDTGTRAVGGKIRDQDGGVTEYRASLDIFVSLDSLCELVKAYATDPKVAQDLCDKLAQAEAATSATARAGVLGAFRNQVDAKTGRGLTAGQAAELKLLSMRL